MGMVEIDVRCARPDDVDWLVTEVEKLAATYGTKRSLFKDEEFSRDFMLNMIKEHVVLIAHRSKDRLGFIAGMISRHPYNPTIKVLWETFWWVEQKHRSSRAKSVLLDEFTRWGRRLCDQIIFNLPDHARVHNSLLRRGYHLKERSYLLEVG